MILSGMLVDELDVTSLSGIRGVLEVAQGVLSDFDLEVVLARVLDAARTLSGASYAALGVLGRDPLWSSSNSSHRGSTKRLGSRLDHCPEAEVCSVS